MTSDTLPNRTARIAGLDGLRACAVLLVVMAHEPLSLLDFLPRGIRDGGATGVDIFFVLSGFLITHLLIAESQKTGKIDISRFYFRRAFRIFPAYYVYIAAVAVSGGFSFTTLPTPATFLAAATYTANYLPQTPNWELGHIWTLCIEEQYYLVWPVCLAFVSRKRALWIAGIATALSPFVRIANYYIDPSSLGSIGRMFHTRADGLMLGSFIALALSLQSWQKTLRVARHPLSAIVAVSLLLFAAPIYRDSFRQSFGFTLDALCCVSILLFSVSQERTLVGRILNSRVLRHLGVISYSLYLWQQLFTGPNTHFAPWNLLAVLAFAEASYWLVERPSLRLRDRLLGHAAQAKQLLPPT